MITSSIDEEGEEGENEDLVAAKGPSKKKRKAAAKKELPFTFPCPEDHDEFLEIIEDIDEEDVPTVVRRIRTLHHPSLADDNKYRLQVSALCTSQHRYLDTLSCRV